MKRKCLAIGIILLFLGACIVPAIAQNIEKPLPASRGNWLYVGGSGPGNYSSITAALQNASDNDTIYVYSGIYSEGRLTINISVSLVGQSNLTTIINHSTFVFNTTNIFLTEFCFQNFSQIAIYSLYSNNVSRNTVTNNLFINSSSGITIINSSYNTIINNRFDQCGIFLAPSLDPFIISTETDDFTNTILNNTVNGKPLVYLEDVNDRDISDAGEIILLRCTNITISHISFGIGTSLVECIKTINTKIMYNNFKNTIIFLINSSGNTIADNWFFPQFGDLQANGLLLVDQCNNNDITNNIFTYQSVIAIFMSSNNSFKQNDFYGSLFSHPMVTFMNAENTWQRNFWMRPRILPKLIVGYKYTIPYSNKTQRSLDIDWRPALKPINPIPIWIYNEMYMQQKMQDPWLQFDWHPAQEPYDVSRMS